MKEKQRKYLLYGLCVTVVLLVVFMGIRIYHKQNLPEKVNILCIGVDKMVPLAERDPLTNSIGQADALFLVSINRIEDEINVIGIPRDTMVYVEKYNSNMEYMGTEALQICTQYAYADGLLNSCELTQKRVEEIFPNIQIDGYAALNINAIMEINDAIGGVEVVIEDDYTAFQMSQWKGYTVNLMGIDTMNYLRVRDVTVGESAYDRIERIKQYVNGFIPKAKGAIKRNPFIIKNIYQSIEENMLTDMELGYIMDLADMVLDSSLENVNLYTLEGQIFVNAAGYEEFYPNKDSLEYAEQLLE